MMLGLGPVLRYELIATARRGRYYLARVVYGAVLLGLLWSRFSEWESFHPARPTHEDLRQFAEATFIAFARVQFAAVLFLLPALVAGVIADEHQRKTLHYLLASRLSSAEIVLGKLGARLVHVGTFVALGLPIVSLLGLYGGLDPEKVIFIYASTFTTVLSFAAFSILISVLARRPRDAVLAAYGLEAFWVLGPPVIQHIGRSFYQPMEHLRPVVNLMMMTNPLMIVRWQGNFYWQGYFYVDWTIWEFLSRIPGLTPMQAVFLVMMGLQTVVGLVILTAAIAGLRPLRGSSWPGAEPRTGWWARLRARCQAIARHRAAAAVTRNEMLAGAIRRPACGDAPLMWKERYTSAGGALRWLSGRTATLFCAVLLGCYLFDLLYPAIAGLWRGRIVGLDTQEILLSLRGATTLLSALALLAIAASSAVAITGEREQDTWISLATTLLTPGEVIRAKQFGAVWTARRFGIALLSIWAAGVLLGAIHPLGAGLAAGVAALAAWCTATVGVFASATARNSTRALAATFVPLLLTIGIWLYAIAGRLVSPREFDANGAFPPGPVSALLVLAGACAVLAAVLTAWSIERLRETWGKG